MQGVSLDIGAGEFTVLLGPSGCGKSTLLRTINRLVTPASGRVFVGGDDVSSMDPQVLRRRIGYVIQAVGLFSHMTVAQNAGIVPSLLGWDRERIARRVDEVLQLVRLDPQRYRTRYPNQLSGGEQQRAGVARAIAASPRVLLMDEPFAAVDAIVRRALQDEISQLAHRLESTVLFVTHDVDEALRLADRIVVLREGRVEQHGTPLELLRNPATPYVRQLLSGGDGLRQLALLPAAAAAGPIRTDCDATVDVAASLREVLAELLRGAQCVGIEHDGRITGSITFEDLRAILQQDGGR